MSAKATEMEAISPSKLYRNEDDKKITSVNVDFDKGIATHKLLEIMPDIDKKDWDKATDITLKNFAELTDKQKADIKNEAFAVLNNKEFEFIFSGKSKAEVPVCGVIDRQVCLWQY